MRRKRTSVTIREGDVWGIYTNDGTIVREVLLVGHKFVKYFAVMDGKNCICLITTFKRWARYGHLEFSLDWSCRDKYGHDLPSPKQQETSP